MAILEGKYPRLPLAFVLINFLNAVKADGKSLVVTPAKDEIVVKSARNIPGVETSMANLINVYDILKAKYLVLDKEALTVIEEVFA